jgi:uncharacterized cupredoxin-like copper-binding protein
MAAYYVLGIILVVWALALAALGLTRPDFPPTGSAGRAMVGVTVLIVAGTLVALLASTSKEHPREDAAKAAEQKKGSAGAAPEEQPAAPSSGATSGKAAPSGGKAAQSVNVTEKEFSIALAGGNSLKAGSYTFAVQNAGKIQHDLTIEGGKVKKTKTPLIDGGKSKDLKVRLEPGRYTFYCSVPGHEQAGMKVAVTVK